MSGRRLPMDAPLAGRCWRGARGTESVRDDRRNHSMNFDAVTYALIAERAQAENTSFAEQVRRLLRRGLESGETVERRLVRKLKPRFSYQLRA